MANHMLLLKKMNIYIYTCIPLNPVVSHPFMAGWYPWYRPRLIWSAMVAGVFYIAHIVTDRQLRRSPQKFLGGLTLKQAWTSRPECCLEMGSLTTGWCIYGHGSSYVYIYIYYRIYTTHVNFYLYAAYINIDMFFFIIFVHCYIYILCLNVDSGSHKNYQWIFLRSWPGLRCWPGPEAVLMMGPRVESICIQHINIVQYSIMHQVIICIHVWL